MEGLEKYETIKDLGEGAQGTVILARDTVLGRRVAIKSLHPSLTADTVHVKRFEEEAKTLAGLEHPSIVTVYEYVANNLGCHLMMEYFEGHPLDDYIKNISGPIVEGVAIDLYIKVLEAMNYIHKKKIIHRDIKPSNIMINDDFEIRLLDFGIAKNTENDPTLTKIGTSAGYTPMYMSPEHCNGDPITMYSDIYSLGVTLWQMVTGKAPYGGFTQGQIYLKVATEQLPSIQSIYPNASLKMNAIIQKATHKNPKERFKTCAAFKKELVALKNQIKKAEKLIETSWLAPQDIVSNLTVKIANGIEADISVNNERHFGVEFSKSIDVSNGTATTVMVEKSGYKKIEQQIFLKKNEVLLFNLEKKTFSFALIITGIQNNIAPYLKNVKPNLNMLLTCLKLGSLWAFESVQLKLKKNNSEVLELKTIETKKAIAVSVESLRPHKKEYAVYLGFLMLCIVMLSSLTSNNESRAEEEVKKEAIETDKIDTDVISIVNFETPETEIPESQTSVKIPVVLSETTDSIVKISLKFSGTANTEDYTILTDTLIIKANQKLGYIELDITNDSTEEPNETILIELENPVYATLGEKSNYSYTILNDDSKGVQKKFSKRGKKYKLICKGYDLYQYHHDGSGKYYRGKRVKQNSKKCGYKAPQPTVRTQNTVDLDISSPPINNYETIIAKEPHDRRTSPNSDGYFITIQDNGKSKCLLKVWKTTSTFIVNEYEIIGKINNIHYSNYKFYTNKSRVLLDHHIINVLNKNKSYLGTKKIFKKRVNFQKEGSTKENKIISN